MIDWRTLLKAPPDAQYPQNEQNRGAGGNSADIAEGQMGTDIPAQPRQDFLASPPGMCGMPSCPSKESSQNQGHAGQDITAPMPPLQPGWRIVYLDRKGKLTGGSDDPAHGTIVTCLWGGRGWTINLTDGQQVPLNRIKSVAAVDYNGRTMGAWTVREHGFDGEGPRSMRMT